MNPMEEHISIVKEYGRSLEESSLASGSVFDISSLPFSKQEIKNAIIAILRTSNDNQMKEYLKAGYTQLTEWQEGVGNSNKAVDLINIDLNQDVKILAKTVLEQADGSKNWEVIVQKELEALKKELQDLNLW